MTLCHRYSNNCSTNPTFCNFGKVLIPQCTFDNWLGDATRTLGNATHPVLACRPRDDKTTKFGYRAFSRPSLEAQWIVYGTQYGMP